MAERVSLVRRALRWWKPYVSAALEKLLEVVATSFILLGLFHFGHAAASLV